MARIERGLRPRSRRMVNRVSIHGMSNFLPDLSVVERNLKFPDGVENWEESTSPALPYGRVENGQGRIYESVFSWLKVRWHSRKCFPDRLNRAPREAKSTPPNFLIFQITFSVVLRITIRQNLVF